MTKWGPETIMMQGGCSAWHAHVELQISKQNRTEQNFIITRFILFDSEHVILVC